VCARSLTTSGYESLVSPVDESSMERARQTHGRCDPINSRPTFSDPFGGGGGGNHNHLGLVREAEEEWQVDTLPRSPTGLGWDPQASINDAGPSSLAARPGIVRYRTAPATVPSSSSGLNIMFDDSGEDAESIIPPGSWVSFRDEPVDTITTSPRSDTGRFYGSIKMSRQARRLSVGGGSHVDAPVIGYQGRARSGRFDSVVSWRSKRGSWAAVSLVDGETSESMDHHYTPFEGRGFNYTSFDGGRGSIALDAVTLPEGGRSRFDSVDTAMQSHRANGGMWGNEDGSSSDSISTSRRMMARKGHGGLNEIRRGTEGNPPVYIDVGDRWARL
jgi:hypothetical protein